MSFLPVIETECFLTGYFNQAIMQIKIARNKTHEKTVTFKLSSKKPVAIPRELRVIKENTMINREAHLWFLAHNEICLSSVMVVEVSLIYE